MKAFDNFQSLHSSPPVVDSPFDNHEGDLHLVLRALISLLNKNYRNSEHLSGETAATYSHTVIQLFIYNVSVTKNLLLISNLL